jgi:uncharacterized protein YjiS (DUF1127 family)
MNAVTGARQQSSLSAAANLLFQALRRIMRIASGIYRTRHGRACLYALPDHVLKDIGISRSEILSVTRFRELDSARRRRD